MFPPIPLDVLLALDQRFPERSPSEGEEYSMLVCRAGQANVVRFLRRMFNEQQQNILSPEDDAQDVPA